MEQTLPLAPHETMDLHEILNMKTLCLAQSKLMQGVVFDRDLKALMQKDVETSIRHVEQLRALYDRFPTTANDDRGFRS